MPPDNIHPNTVWAIQKLEYDRQRASMTIEFLNGRAINSLSRQYKLSKTKTKQKISETIFEAWMEYSEDHIPTDVEFNHRKSLDIYTARKREDIKMIVARYQTKIRTDMIRESRRCPTCGKL